MNKNSAQKLKVFMYGLASRIIDNKDYFCDININLKSGTKYFTAKVDLVENKLEVNFNADIKSIEIEEITDFVFENSLIYDEIELTYNERGESLILKADNKNVSMKNISKNNTGINNKNNKENIRSEISQIGNRDYFIKTGQADNLLKEIGIIGENGKVKNEKIRKYNQIDHFIELITPLLKKICEKNEVINVVDCGCGKSYLSFVLNYYIKEVLKKSCSFTGLDISENVIEESTRMAKNLGYKNMEFFKTDIRNYKPSKTFHLLISLHACDTATDEALAFGLKNKLKAIIVVPCCHKEFLSQYSYEPINKIIKHGILKARIADTLTEGFRSLFLEAHGYDVKVVEYISPLETPKNIMISAVLEKSYDDGIMDEYKMLSEKFGVNLTIEKLIF